MMAFDDFARAYTGFFKVLTLELGLKCPITCRHCCYNCSPDRVEEVDSEIMRAAIQQFSEIETSEIIALTGGEPFAYPDLLETALEEVTRFSHLKSVVISNGFWATSPEKARDTLENLPPIHQLCLSTDVYHNEFIPLAFIKHAILACEALDIPMFLEVCIEPEDSFQGTLKKALGDDLYQRTFRLSTSVQPIGRGMDLNITPKRERNNVLWDSCFLAGSPFILYDGTVVTCCNCTRLRGMASKSMSDMCGSPLEMGRLSQSRLQDIFLETNKDMILQALRTMGVGGILKLLSETGTYPKGGLSYSYVCDLCIALLTDPHVVNRLRGLLNSQSYVEEIAFKRAYYFGESVEG